MADRTIKRGSTSVILRIPIEGTDSDTSASVVASSSELFVTVSGFSAGALTYSGSGEDGTVETIAALGTYVAPSEGCCRARGLNQTFMELQLDDAFFADTGRQLCISITDSNHSSVSGRYTVALSNLDIENGETTLDATVAPLTVPPADTCSPKSMIRWLWQQAFFQRVTSPTASDVTDDSGTVIGRATIDIDDGDPADIIVTRSKYQAPA